MIVNERHKPCISQQNMITLLYQNESGKIMKHKLINPNMSSRTKSQ